MIFYPFRFLDRNNVWGVQRGNMTALFRCLYMAPCLGGILLLNIKSKSLGIGFSSKNDSCVLGTITNLSLVDTIILYVKVSSPKICMDHINP